jgi:general secretion pathway protein G
MLFYIYNTIFMLQKALKKGFTLIELLVVITIIGILATGAVTTYTSQIQKARDTTRVQDLSALKGAIEQVYQDDAEYPGADTFYTDVKKYLRKLPRDSKHNKTCNNGGSGDVAC